MSKALAPLIAVLTLAALTGAALAYTYTGTNGDDDIEVERGPSSAELLGGNDTFLGAKGIYGEDDPWGGSDHVDGGPGNDDINGRTYVDMLRGRGGNDVLKGGRHRDGVYGGPGNDTLIGGSGVDHYKPGRGEDTCIGQRKDYGVPNRCEHVELTGG